MVGLQWEKCKKRTYLFNFDLCSTEIWRFRGPLLMLILPYIFLTLLGLCLFKNTIHSLQIGLLFSVHVSSTLQPLISPCLSPGNTMTVSYMTGLMVGSAVAYAAYSFTAPGAGRHFPTLNIHTPANATGY